MQRGVGEATTVESGVRERVKEILSKFTYYPNFTKGNDKVLTFNTKYAIVVE